MPFLLTHLLWGYVVSRLVTKDPRYVAAGMLMAVLPDVDAILPLASHHGFLHTPLFALVVATSLYGGSKDEVLLRVCALGLLTHLLLDTLASGAGLMWLYPTSEALLPIGASLPATAQVVVRVFLLVIPLQVVLHWSRSGQGGPMDLLRDVGSWVGGRTAGLLAVPATALLAYAGWSGLLAWVG